MARFQTVPWLDVPQFHDVNLPVALLTGPPIFTESVQFRPYRGASSGVPKAPFQVSAWLSSWHGSGRRGTGSGFGIKPKKRVQQLAKNNVN